MRLVALLVAVAVAGIAGAATPPPAEARTVAAVRAGTLSPVVEACLATCIGKRLEARRPGSAAAVWCDYGGGARWACLTLLVERGSLPECRQLLVTPAGEVVESAPSPCPVRLEQPFTIHTK